MINNKLSKKNLKQKSKIKKNKKCTTKKSQLCYRLIIKTNKFIKTK